MKHVLASGVLMLALPAAAEPPEVVDVRIAANGTISVTLRHPDSGWDHYADGWRVETLDGEVLGIRDLLHPHETEQPFTRTLSGVQLPPSATEVAIRARCNVTGWSDETLTVALPE